MALQNTGSIGALPSPAQPARTGATEGAAAPAPAPQPGAAHEIATSANAASTAREMEFARDPQTGQMIVRVYDRATGELVRQIPSEEALAVARSLGKMSGVFVSTRG